MNVPSGYTALGLIGFTDQGVYNSATAYVRNDIVHYNGNLWRCLVDDTTAVTPAEGANWTVYLAEPTSAAEDIIAPVEATATSTRIYAIGDQLILADVLYDVTQAINIGDTLTVGTNIAAADTIVEQIAEKANSADLATVATSGAYSDLSGKPTLGTAAAKNVPASGNASTTEVVMGDDTRLTNARNAADVSAWAKAANKPIYNGSEIKTSTAKTGTAQQSISDTVTSGTSMDNVVGTMLDNDKTLDTNVTSLKETFTNQSFTNGAVNLLPNNGTTQVNAGITYTVNEDGSVTANGTATAESWLYLGIGGKSLKAGKYRLTGCPSGGSATTYELRLSLADTSGGGQTYLLEDLGNGITFTNSKDRYYRQYCGIRIASGTTVSNLIFKPMLTVADMPNSDYNHYVPYAMTNKELTDVAQDAIGNYVYEKATYTSLKSDGVKTYATLLQEVAAAFVSDIQNLADDEIAMVVNVTVNDITMQLASTAMMLDYKNTITICSIDFSKLDLGANKIFLYWGRINSNANTSKYFTNIFTTGGNVPDSTDMLNSVPLSNKYYSIGYRVYKKIS